MTKTALICGYGPGISNSMAQKLGAEGYAVALVGRTPAKLEAGVAALEAAGVTARAYPCDLSNTESARLLVGQVRAESGPVGVIHYNAYAGVAGDLVAADADELRKVFDVGVTGAVTVVQEALDDLKAAGDGSVLITGGGFAFYGDEVDAMVVQYRAMGLAVIKAAQHKLTGLLHHRLKGEGVYVGSVVVLGLVKGTAFDPGGGGGLDPDDIADAFLKLHRERDAVSVELAGD